MSNKIKTKKLIEDFNKKFPHVWVRPGVDFDGNEKRILWSGEGSNITSEVGQISAFCCWTESCSYEFGVHKKIVEWAYKNGLYWEMYDGGTWFAFSKDFK